MLKKVYIAGFVFCSFMTLATIGGMETSSIGFWSGTFRIALSAVMTLVFAVLGDLLDFSIKKALPEVGTSDKALKKTNNTIVAYERGTDNGK